MPTPTPGTIPSLTEYQAGALTIASTVYIEIVDSNNATSAASYKMSQADFVGKAPSIMLNANPVASDLIAFYQVANTLPKVTTIGNLAIPSGNMPTGGATGTFLAKVSGTNYDANWTAIGSFLTASTSITLSGSTTVAISVSPFGISSAQIATNAVGNIQFRQGSPSSLVGVSGAATANVADILGGNATSVMLATASGIGFGGLTTSYMPVELQLAGATANGVFYSRGAGSAILQTNFGTTGMFLMGNGASGAPSFSLINLGASTSVTGTTTITNGGTGTNVLGVFGVMLGGTTSVSVVAATTAGMFLQAQNATTAPAYALVNLANSTNVTGIVSFANGGTGTSTLATPWGAVIGGTTALRVTAAGGTGTILAGSTATSAPSFVALSGVIDQSANGTTQNNLLIRNAATWIGTSVTGLLNTVISSTQGTLIYRNDTTWLGLGAGTAGWILQTLSTSSNPQWVGGGEILLNTIAANQIGSAVDTTSFTSRYSRYIVRFDNVCPVSTATVTTYLQMLIATSGTNFVSGSYVSAFRGWIGGAIATSQTTSFMLLSGVTATSTIGTSPLYGANGWVELTSPSDTAHMKSIFSQLNYMATGAAGTSTMASGMGNCFWNGTTSAITGIAISFQTGNIATGTIRIYGVV